MSTIRRYPSPVLANAAVDLLRRHGIVAVMVTDADPYGGVGVTTGYGRYAVIIDDHSRRAEAGRLLTDMAADPNPPTADPGWEDQARPDLSLLTGAPDAPCPHCGESLPLDESLRACPRCGGPVDVVQVLVETRGPEVLAPCYPESSDEPLDAALKSAALRCPSCRYSLEGLPTTGYCPECGQPYSKRDMLRG